MQHDEAAMTTCTRAAILCAALLVSAPAVAMEPNVPCRNPVVFPGADVNVIVLPFTYAPGAGTEGPALVNRLTGLVQFDVLLSIAKYGSVGVIQLIGDPQRDECTSDAVMQKVLGTRPGAREVAKPGKALVFLWGRIFTDAGRIYLQSYVRFLRVGRPEMIELKAGQELLRGPLSAQSFAFPARQFTQEDLTRISAQYLAAVRTHTSPEGPESGALPDDMPIPYAVTEIRGDWMRLEAFRGEGPSGWVRARTSTEGWSLRQHMPELGFVEGLSGFLVSRVRQDSGMNAGVAMRVGEAALRDYLRTEDESRSSVPAESMALARAVPRQMLGIAAEQRGDTGAAVREFGAAATHMPYAGTAVNLDVIARVHAAFSGQPGREDTRVQASRLMAAAAADPSNRVIMGNLASIYTLLVHGAPAGTATWAPLTGDERSDLEKQATELRRLATR
jgi:hypothetical protein